MNKTQAEEEYPNSRIQMLLCVIQLQGELKLNSNVAVKQDSSHIEVRAVVRHAEGHVVATITNLQLVSSLLS
ncbi:hypothetical protein EZV62_010606 [Acer yangbiense]|uniref:Uncharacterized protein n=1 Tax=Acer yangbiense TaxID=1000413 RepID=A0A5C7I535_9ROSI|nr:hypothetical protein EZV62_010606 [Acer yangbiense]